tara:strand:+ start:2746 stop:3402 length:657 start_codon:yes stop_codon:yes gene_type:complete
MKLHFLFFIITLIFSQSLNAEMVNWIERGYSHYDNLGNESLTLTYTNLSAHEYIKMNWDLYIIDSWDGYEEGNQYSQDEWGVSVDGNEFSWFFSISSLHKSTTPDTSSHYYNTAESIEPLPVKSLWHRADLVRAYEDYNDGWIIPHSSDTLTVTFFGRGLQSLNDESWAMGDLHIASGENYVSLDNLGNLQDVNISTFGSTFVFAIFALGYRLKRKTP